MGQRGLATAALICVSVAAGGCDSRATSASRPAAVAVLSCGDSAGQQAGSGRPVNGIESVALRGDSNAYDPLPAWHTRAGRKYLVWKVFLAVAPRARPFRLVTVIRPASARLFYASPGRWGAMSGAKFIPPPPRAVRLAACGRRFAGYTGGILVARPACVTISVTGPGSRPGTVTVPILVAHC